VFAELQRHRREQWLRREYLLLESWNHLARGGSARGRLIAFFGSSNLFWPYSVDRQLAYMLSRSGGDDVVLNLGSFGFGDSSSVVATTLALLEAYRPRPIDLVVFEVTPNEMPAIDKESARTFLPRSKRGQLVLDYEDAAPIVERMQHVQVPLVANLERLAEIARAAIRPFPVLILDYESNLRQWPPSVSYFSVPLSPADAAEFRRLLAGAIGLVRRGELEHAYDLLTRCERIDPNVAITSYLSAKVAEGRGDRGRALSLYRQSRDRDLLRGRLSRDQLMPELDRWCQALGFWFVSVPAIVRFAAGHAIPGFDQFVDDVHYRPHLHYAIARAIVDRLGREGFLDASRGPETLERVLAAVDGQQLYTLVQTALNLVLAPASPYNDERVAEGLRKLDAARGMGADPALVEEYRLRFMLLAGERREAAGLMEQRALRALDPIELALRLSGEPGSAGTPPNERLTAEIAPRIRQLLLSRFGVNATEACADVELIAMGVDSLGLAELMMTLEEMFNPARLQNDFVPTGFIPFGQKTRAVSGHEFGLKLPGDEKAALLAFLRSL
jgi:tetratricopeptide (TPR) repeat protein